MLKTPETPLVVAHWGSFRAEMENGRPRRLIPLAQDPDPRPWATA